MLQASTRSDKLKKASPRKQYRHYKKVLSKKTRTYRYYYQGKRVAASRYYAYQKKKQQVAKRTATRTKSGGPKISKTSYKGKYTSGTNIEIKTNFLVSTTPSGEVIDRLESLYQRVKKQLKFAMYFKIYFVALWDNGNKEKGDLSTNRSFIIDYSNSSFRSRQITSMVQELYDMHETSQLEEMPDLSLLNETPDRFKEAEDIRVYKLAINQRNKSNS